MAIYHLSVKAVSRSTGRSATAAAAYRAGCEIVDERTGAIHDYRRKGGVESAGLVLPAGAPEWAADRAALWNAAEQAEARKNSTVAREFEIALPAELSYAEQERLAHDFAREIVERHGCAADVAIHAPGKEGDNRNHHAHILLSTRRLTPEGFAEKTRELDDAKTGEVMRWRERFAELQNERLRENGIEACVDHRSLEAQGIDNREPTRHLGPTASAIERRTGEPSRKRLDYEAEASERLARAKEAGDLERKASETEKSILDLSGDLAKARAEAVIERQRTQLAKLTDRVKAREAGLDVSAEMDAIGLPRRTDDPKKRQVPPALYEAFDILADSVKAARAEQEKQRSQAQIDAEKYDGMRFFLNGVNYRDPQSFEQNLDRLRKAAQKPEFSEIVDAQNRGWEKYSREATDTARRSWLDSPEGLEKRERYWADRVKVTSSGPLSFLRKNDAIEATEALESVRIVIKERNAAGQAFLRAFEQERKEAAENFEKALPYLDEARELFNQRVADQAEFDRRAEARQQEKERTEAQRQAEFAAIEKAERERERAADARATPAPRGERKPEVSKGQEPEIDDGMDFGL